MMYLVLRALHIFFVILWMSGMIFAPLVLKRLAVPGRSADDRSIAALRVAFAAVTLPAMAAVWIVGIYLAMKLDAFSEHWLMGKLVLVIVLSGLHGMFSGQLRRAATDRSYMPSSVALNMHWVVVALVAVIVSLATIRIV
jgi:putative membrane protein